MAPPATVATRGISERISQPHSGASGVSSVIAALMAMRVPIDGAAGVGYVMRPGYDLPPLMFDREEVEAIAVGLQLLGRTGDKGLLAAGRRAGAKIAGVLPERREDEFDDGRFVVSDFGAPAAAGMDVLRAAVRNARRLALTYRDERRRTTERICLPLAVVYYVEATVLAAWCELREDFRHFRADRIVACHETGDSFAGQAPRLRRDWHAGDRHGRPDTLRMEQGSCSSDRPSGKSASA